MPSTPTPTTEPSRTPPSGDLWETQPARPAAAAALGLAGAVLIALQSAEVILNPGNYHAPNFGGFTFGVASLGAMGFVEAVVLVAASAGAFLSPRAHLELGVIVISIALLSFYVGGGFFLGALLAYVGGILAIFHEPKEVPVKPIPTGTPAAAEIEEDPVLEADLIDSGRAVPVTERAGRGGP